MAEITSRRHPIVARFKAAARGHASDALVDGWHLLHEAEAAGLQINTVAYRREPLAERDATLLERVARHAVVRAVSTGVMDALSPVRTPAGVAAIVARRDVAFSRLIEPAPALVVVAIDMQDPGNVGAVVRAAEAGGATGAVFAGASADPWSWKSLRAAMGSTFRLPVVSRSDLSGVWNELRAAGVTLCGAVPRGGISIYAFDWRRPVALVLGGEGPGLVPGVLSLLETAVSIPMHGAVESLNVAVATGVIVFEASRQRSRG